jgi:molecular chaperone DnaJ
MNGAGFKEFWEDLDEFFGAATQSKGKQEKSKKGRDIIVSLDISFMDAIHGCQKDVQFERVSVCSGCNGTKCKSGTSPTYCSTCGGSGRMNYKQGFMNIQMECNACNGEGKTIRNPCLKCYGKGQTNVTVKETINIPKGVDDNMNLRMQKKVNLIIYIY